MQRWERSALVGVFSNRDDAERCVEQLRQAGFRDDQIGFMMQDSSGSGTTGTTLTDRERYGDGGGSTGGGLVAGAVTGGLLGAAAALLIPGFGPVIAGGILASAFAGAAAGAVMGGIAGALIDLGLPEGEAQYYEQEFQSGRILVTVKTEGRYDEARSIMESCGAYFEEATAPRTGFTDTRITDDRMTDTAFTGERRMDADERMTNAPFSGERRSDTGNVVQLREEELHARTTPVETGEVQVHKEVVTEHRTIDVPVKREEVYVERHPVDRDATDADLSTADETIRVPVMEEDVVVEKRAKVREELEIGKRQVNDTERVSGDVQREEARIEHTGDVDIDDDGTMSEEERLRRQREDLERRRSA